MTILERNLEKVVAKGGVKSRADAMRQAGYSPRTARTPSKARTWGKLLEKYLPDDRLIKVHDSLLDSDQDTVRLGALGLGYKVKGKLTEGNLSTTNILVIPSELMAKYGITSNTKDSSK